MHSSRQKDTIFKNKHKGETMFSLVYRMEAVITFEVKIPSLRVLSEAELEEVEWAHACFDQLNLIEGKRLDAINHGK